MNLKTAETFDVIVVGGGPGGSTLATFTAMKQHRVLLLERERFPRHQVGESLLPATINGICVMLGVEQELRDAQFTYKLGGTYRWGKHEKPWSFTFGPSTIDPGSSAFAYQVERMKFDQILLDNAVRRGVDVRQECRVLEVLKTGDRVCGVLYVGADGNPAEAVARYVVDASGHQSTIARVAGDRVYSKFFQNVAVYGYFLDAARLPPPNSGNIFCEAFADGWFWYIPLSDHLTSVGAVVAKEHADRIVKDGPENALRYFIESSPLVRRMLEGASRVATGPYEPVRVRKDYSYCTTAFAVPGLVLIGDAACFIDPVFSSGVHLATYSALLAARSINACLSGAVEEKRAFAEFEARYRREFSKFYEFLVAFYDMDKDLDSYFWSARKILNTEERGNDAFVRLVAGLSDRGEPLFSSASSWFDSRRGLGEAFRAVYEGASTPQADVFFRDLRKGIVETINQARLGDRIHSDQPISRDGLIASADGLAWREPALVSM